MSKWIMLFLCLNSFSFDEIAFSYRMKALYEVKDGNFITQPENTWVPIFEFHAWQDFSFEARTLCLYYKTPFRSSKGHLILETHETKKSCSTTPSGKVLQRVEGIGNFTYQLLDQELILIWDLGRAGLEQKSVDLINLKNQKDRSGYQIHSISPSKQWRMLNAREENPKFCHQVTFSCDEIIANECNSSCRGAWYSVLAAGCLNITSKFCGPASCGEKGKLACMRGVTQPGINGSDICNEPKEFGFCQKGLEPSCENGYLVCF